ncbi:hypothetical protein [Mangrovicoccus sp. HB161399]|uniref:hypothetical protein n=1 Tax=Mangrovicoccus sp. HB161399 TaxID=2720392 RepID=UPI001552C90E|nr:hypothetical protein [Mangrovicoccus sp. HB161399]
MRQAFAIAAALWAAGGAHADPYEICAAADAATPGYCDCAIVTAQESGIDGPALEQLLADDWAAIPKEIADRFSLIVVECLRATETAPANPAPVLSGGQGATTPLDQPMPPTGRDSIAPVVPPAELPSAAGGPVQPSAPAELPSDGDAGRAMPAVDAPAPGGGAPVTVRETPEPMAPLAPTAH